jgi:magnesium-transporting ATPase (P-type)
MTNTAPTSGAVAWQRLGRVTGVAGLAAVVLIFVVLVGTREEPPFTATADEFLTHYRAPNTVASDFRSFAFTVALVTFLWFVVALSILLRRAEGEAPWRSTIAMASGVLFVALVLSGSEIAAAFRADDLDPQLARYAFDESQAAFANARVALGSFALCCGWVIASTRFLPRWVGWLAIASGVGLALGRISWTNYMWLLPYLMFWLWVLTVAVLLLRRNFRGVAQSG